MQPMETRMTGRMALEGIRVICFGMGGAAPLGTSILADHGAEVIKVEPRGGDWSRTTPGLGTREFNRNKKGIAIDLKHPDGLALARRLIGQADVMMESFRPGVMAKLGLGYEEMRAHNPRLVYCSVTGFGQTGPWKDKPGVDGIIQALSGMMSVLGADGDAPQEPIKVPFPVVDMTGGLLAAQGILLALMAREKHGIGQHVDLSLLEAAMVMQKSSLTRFLSTGRQPPKTGSRAPYATPNQAYRTKDGHLMLAAYSPARWKALCEHVLNRPDLVDDPRYQGRNARQTWHREIQALIETVLAGRTTAEWLPLMESLDLMVAPINDYPALAANEQVKARGAIQDIAFPDGSTMQTIAPAPRLSETPGSVRAPYPHQIGLHTKEILLSFGLSEAEIAQLDADGAIGIHRPEA